MLGMLFEEEDLQPAAGYLRSLAIDGSADSLRQISSVHHYTDLRMLCVC